MEQENKPKKEPDKERATFLISKDVLKDFDEKVKKEKEFKSNVIESLIKRYVMDYKLEDLKKNDSINPLIKIQINLENVNEIFKETNDILESVNKLLGKNEPEPKGDIKLSLLGGKAIGLDIASLLPAVEGIVKNIITPENKIKSKTSLNESLSKPDSEKPQE